MELSSLEKILKILEGEYRKWQPPVLAYQKARGYEPFRVLISTLLSLRTKDQVTKDATGKLFSKVKNVKQLRAVPVEEIEKLIYPVGFYRTKAKNINKICGILLENYDGKVPDTIEELVKLPGVGRKTANLVVTEGFGKEGICVDIHVHRISNRFGFVKTKTPDATEMVLRQTLPKKWWPKYNVILVSFGQTICAPVSPFCSKCPVADLCERVGVQKRR
ncbi:endonuclease III [bacterium]|nr:endonuclease III [bacterium]